MDVNRRDENKCDDNDENKWTGQWEVNKSTLNGRLFSYPTSVALSQST